MSDLTDLRLAPLPLLPAEQSARARMRGIWYFCEGQLRALRSYGISLLISSIGIPLLTFIALGIGLGALMEANGTLIDGVPYVVFVAPAVLIATIASSAGGEFTYPVMDGFKWRRLYYAGSASPLTPGQIALGHVLAVMIRFAGQAAIFWVIMVRFGVTSGPWSWVVIPIGMLTALAFGAPMMAYAASIIEDRSQFTFVQRFIVMPMTLFAGTYFPLSAMPIGLQWIGWISPLWHGSQLARVAAYGMALQPWLLAVHIAVLAGFAAVGLMLAVRVYTRRLGA